MRFERQLMTELPFMVNLPDGNYVIDQTNYSLEVLQNRLAAPVRTEDGRPDYRIGSADELRNAFGEAFAALYKLPLHTIIRHLTVKDVLVADVAVPSDRDIAMEWVRVSTLNG